MSSFGDLEGLIGEREAIRAQLERLDATIEQIKSREALRVRLDGKALLNCHGKYLTACPDGALHVDTSDLNAWERWTVELHGDKYAFKGAHGKYLCNEGDGRWTVSRDAVGAWESFDVVADGDHVSVFCPEHSKFMCACPDEVKSAEACNAWERYTVHG